MNKLRQFNFEGNQVRTVIGEDNEPRFVASDVARILGYEQPHIAINRHCDDVTNHHVIDKYGRRQKAKVIPEPDVYRLIMKSRTPRAKKFERWVMEEVLPTIRKTGKYNLKELPDRKQLAQMVIDAENEMEEYKKALDEAKPKAAYHDEVLQSKSSYITTQIAKELGMSATELNKRLHVMGVQFKSNGTGFSIVSTRASATPTPALISTRTPRAARKRICRLFGLK